MCRHIETTCYYFKNSENLLHHEIGQTAFQEEITSRLTTVSILTLLNCDQNDQVATALSAADRWDLALEFAQQCADNQVGWISARMPCVTADAPNVDACFFCS